MRQAIKYCSILLFMLVLAYCWKPEASRLFVDLYRGPISLAGLPLYGLVTILTFAGLLVIPFLRHDVLRILLGIAASVLLALEHGLLVVTGSVAESATYQALLDATQELCFAAQTYGNQIALDLVIMALFLPGFLIRPSRQHMIRLPYVVAPVAAFLAVTFATNAWLGKIEGYPPPFSTAAKLTLAYLSHHPYMGPRDPLTIKPVAVSRFDKVVFIVDESVRGDYLQVTNPALDNTPFLASISNRIADFGPAVSYTNCSARSRMALRTGIRLDTLPDPAERAMHQPTMWQYARNAGYRTVYLNGWFTIRKNTSFTTLHELTFVDLHEGPVVQPVSDADNRIADRLAQLLKEPGKAFIFVEKIGVHPPYEGAIPPDYSYAPSRFPKDLATLKPYQAKDLRDYSRALRWRVDTFFERLFPAIDRPDVLVIYTSDHGQNLYDKPYDATHCTVRDPSAGEALVPLIALTGNPEELRLLRQSAARAPSSSLHEDILPTLYEAMGYDIRHLAEPFPTSLYNLPDRPTRRFFTGNPFASSMRWNVVERRKP